MGNPIRGYRAIPLPLRFTADGQNPIRSRSQSGDYHRPADIVFRLDNHGNHRFHKL